MELRALPTPALEPDLSNLDSIILRTLLEALQGPNRRSILIKLGQDVLAAGQAGQGVELSKISQPIRQSELESESELELRFACQTLAILNGIRAIGQGGTLTSISSDTVQLVAQIRQRIQRAGLRGETGIFNFATESTVTSLAHFSMTNVAIELSKLGIPLRRLTADDNPLKLARNLFRPKRFMGVSGSSHATSIIPLANPSPQQFAVVLDSINEAIRIMSLADFLTLIMVKREPGNDYFEIYEWTK